MSRSASRTRSGSSTFPVTVILPSSGSHFAAVQEQGRNTYATGRSPPRYRSGSVRGKRSFLLLFFAAYCCRRAARALRIQSSRERAKCFASSGSARRGSTSSTVPSGGRIRSRIVRARSEIRTRQGSREPSGRGRFSCEGVLQRSMVIFRSVPYKLQWKSGKSNPFHLKKRKRAVNFCWTWIRSKTERNRYAENSSDRSCRRL